MILGSSKLTPAMAIAAFVILALLGYMIYTFLTTFMSGSTGMM